MRLAGVLTEVDARAQASPNGFMPPAAGFAPAAAFGAGPSQPAAMPFQGGPALFPSHASPPLQYPQPHPQTPPQTAAGPAGVQHAAGPAHMQHSQHSNQPGYGYHPGVLFGAASAQQVPQQHAPPWQTHYVGHADAGAFFQGIAGCAAQLALWMHQQQQQQQQQQPLAPQHMGPQQPVPQHGFAVGGQPQGMAAVAPGSHQGGHGPGLSPQPAVPADGQLPPSGAG